MQKHLKTPPCHRVSMRSRSARAEPTCRADLLAGRAAADLHAAGARRATSCIIGFLWGGPPHQDLWDLKPEAPAEVRGEFKPIATSVPGISISELLPRTAQ